MGYSGHMGRGGRPSLRVLSDPRPPPVIPNAVLGMLIFVVTEAMLFAGLISAISIIAAGSVGPWPPPDQPRLPVAATAVNTAALLLSGILLAYAGVVFRRDRERARTPLLISIALGAFFVAFQGWEWVGLIREGLTVTSSTHGSFFYLIVGLHAAHAVGALVWLAVVARRLFGHRLSPASFASAQVLWFFVVGVWPILYGTVYL